MLPEKEPGALAARVGLLLSPILVILLAGLYFTDIDRYDIILDDDHIVEWTTAISFLLASIVSLAIVIRIRHESGYLHWFFLFYCVASFLVTMEEISWGQRIFNLTAPDLFKRLHVGGEINLHNIIAGQTGIRNRQAYAPIVLAYGVLLPILARNDNVKSFLQRKKIVVPPNFLILSFLIAAILAFVDEPTGEEEEIAEMILGISFLWIAVAEYCKVNPRAFRKMLERYLPSSS